MSEDGKWCDFQFRVINRNQEKKNAVSILDYFLETAVKQASLRADKEKRLPGFWHRWLGDLLIEMGVPYTNTESGPAFKVMPEQSYPNICPCHGTLDDYRYFAADNGEDALDIDTTCACRPMDELWEEIFEYLGIQYDILISYWGSVRDGYETSIPAYYGTSVELDDEDTRYEIDVSALPEGYYGKLVKVLGDHKIWFNEAAGFLSFGAIADKLHEALVNDGQFPEISNNVDAKAFLDKFAVVSKIRMGTLFKPEQLATKEDMAFIEEIATFGAES